MEKETKKGLIGIFWVFFIMLFVGLSIGMLSQMKLVESIICFFLAIVSYKFLDYNFKEDKKLLRLRHLHFVQRI